MSSTSLLPLIDLEPETDTFRAEVLEGLQKSPKSIPCKFFYDRRGSELFEKICRLEAYYPTRTEKAIMRMYGEAMANRIGPGALVIEYGSGSSEKTRILLRYLDRPAGYVPIDISREQLLEAAAALQEEYQGLRVQPVCADYTDDAFTLPAINSHAARRVVYFPGSTIGNFNPAEAEEFLRRIARVAGAGGGLLIGVDLKKDPSVLEAAYNDPKGVTAAFNKNLLRRMNRELEADFELDQFSHQALWLPEEGCIEMRLVSTGAQSVTVAGSRFHFEPGEYIRTERSYKYHLEDFVALARAAGFRVEDVWTDDRKYFSVQYLSVQ